MKPQIDIIITTCASLENLSKVLESLKEQTYKNFKCFVIDDLPSNEVSNYLKNQYPEVLYTPAKSRSGPAKNRNTAISKGTSELIVTLDDDVSLAKNWLETMTQFLHDNKNVGCVGSQIRFLDRPDTINSIGGYITESGFGIDIFINKKIVEINKIILNNPLKVSFVCSAGMIFRRDTYNKIGGFDPKYFYLSEDTDFCLRINALGLDVTYNPNAILFHKFHGVSCRFKKSYFSYLLVRNSFYTLFKNFTFKNSVKRYLLFCYDYKKDFFLLARIFFWLLLQSANIILWKKKINGYRTVNSNSIIKFNYELEKLIFKEKNIAETTTKKREIYKNFINSFSKIRAKKKKTGKGITNLIFQITNSCNAKCKHCFLKNSLNKLGGTPSLTLEEISTFFKSLGHCDNVVLGGGEPFLSKKLLPICQIIDTYNHSSITIPTNCYNPIKIANTVEKILDTTNLSLKISLSLDGLKETHEKIRGIPGLFDKVTETYKKLEILKYRYFPRLSLQINSVVFQDNYGEFIDFVNYVQNTFQLSEFNFEIIRGHYDSGLVRPITLSQYDTLIHTLEEKKLYDKKKNYLHKLALETLYKKKQVIPCCAGENFIVLDYAGNISQCEILDGVTNIKEIGCNYNNLKKLSSWNNGIKDIKDNKCWCTHMCFLQGSLAQVKGSPLVL